MTRARLLPLLLALAFTAGCVKLYFWAGPYEAELPPAPAPTESPAPLPTPTP